MKILTGNSNKQLSNKISKNLKNKLVNTSIRKFADGEIYIEINENIRGNSIFIIQSVSSPANDNLMELLLCIDALKRSSAKNITTVIPYFGYARQDRKVVPRTSISAKLVSNLITNAGADRVVTVDLHAGQIQGFFDIPVDNLFATPIFAKHIKRKIKSKNIICVAPDVGGVERARALGKKLDVGLAIVDKRRPSPGKSQVMNVIGNVKNKVCILTDDIIDSGGTIVNAADALLKRGAKEVHVYATHGVFSGDAVKKIKNSKIKNLVITDSIDSSDKLKKVRNIKPYQTRYGPLLGTVLSGIDMWLTTFGLTMPFTLSHNKPDHKTLRKASECNEIDYPKPDGEFSFDKLSSVFLSNTNHEEDQPCHLTLKDSSLPIEFNLPVYAEPAQRYCPAGVYEIIKSSENGESCLQINAQNCVHCKTCDIKDPSQNINWVAPQGGEGPLYGGM